MQHGSAEQAAVVRSAIEQGDVDGIADHAQQPLDFTRQQAMRDRSACAAISSLAEFDPSDVC